MNKLGKGNAVWVILVIMVALVAWNQGWIGPAKEEAIIKQAETAAISQELADLGFIVGTNGQAICVHDGNTVKVSSRDKYVPSTEANGAHRVLVKRSNGEDVWMNWGLYAEDDTFEATPGDHYDIIMQENSTGHYPVEHKGRFKCAPAETIWGLVPAMDTGLNTNSWIVSSQGQVIDITNNNQTLGANDIKTVTFHIVASSETAFGVGPGKNKMTCQYNNTLYDGLSVSGAYIIGQNGASTPVTIEETVNPGFYIFSAQYYVEESFDLPVIEDSDELVFKMTVDVASYNPTTIGVNQHINCTLYDTTIFRNTDTDMPMYGIEDNDHADKGQTSLYEVFLSVE